MSVRKLKGMIPEFKLTANPRIIDVSYHDFHGFPVVNWY